MAAEATGTRSNSAIDVSHHFRLMILIASLPFNYGTSLVERSGRQYSPEGRIGILLCSSLLITADQGCGISASTNFDGPLSLSQFPLIPVTAKRYVCPGWTLQSVIYKLFI